jgi:glycine cleavage system H protein
MACALFGFASSLGAAKHMYILIVSRLKGVLLKMADLTYPDGLKYAESDEWIRVEDDGTAVIGITDYAQDALNDLVYVEMMDTGTTLDAGAAFGEVESVKAASEVYMPVAGEIVEVNETLEDEPEIVNDDPYGEGWLVKIKITDDSNLENLMDTAAYKEFCDNR